ncbi:MAG: methylisocitrate lyase [Thaumarchaeota archaeon]|nr:methylisocitrate lyase [Nitrososphaerota archaeon]
MSKELNKASVLRRLIKDHAVVVPGVFNAITAKIAERVGFEGVYISGAGLANARGLPDLGLLSMSEVLDHASAIANSVNIPAIADIDTGFGEVLNLMRAVQEFERAGIVAVQIEDQIMPKRCGHLEGKELVSSEDMVQKIKGAIQARQNPDFVIIARTDARAVEGLNGAIKRAQTYAKAGADVIFPEALESKVEFSKFAKIVRVPLMANMTEFGKTPYISVREFESMGYNIVIFPMTVFRTMTKAVEDTLRKLKKNGTQKQMISKMHTRKQIYNLVNYDEYEKIDRRFRRVSD